eukprot:42214-Pelagomonas_calceolata.AAC.2
MKLKYTDPGMSACLHQHKQQGALAPIIALIHTHTRMHASTHTHTHTLSCARRLDVVGLQMFASTPPSQLSALVAARLSRSAKGCLRPTPGEVALVIVSQVMVPQVMVPQVIGPRGWFHRRQGGTAPYSR